MAKIIALFWQRNLCGVLIGALVCNPLCQTARAQQTPRKPELSALRDRADRAYEAGDYEKAATLYRTLAKVPLWRNIYYRLGKSYQELSQNAADADIHMRRLSASKALNYFEIHARRQRYNGEHQTEGLFGGLTEKEIGVLLFAMQFYDYNEELFRQSNYCLWAEFSPFVVEDMNGDGVRDCVFLGNKPGDNRYIGLVLCDTEGPHTTLRFTPDAGKEIGSLSELKVIDVDGDGVKEILLVYFGMYKFVYDERGARKGSRETNLVTVLKFDGTKLSLDKWMVEESSIISDDKK